MRKNAFLLACVLATFAGSGRAFGATVVFTGLLPGKYVATITPSINDDQADKIRKELRQIDGLRSVNVKSYNSSVHFTVKRGTHVDALQVKNGVKEAVPDSTMSDPGMEPAGSSNVPG